MDNYGLHVIDITDPTIPVEVGSYYSAFFNHDIVISGNLLYAACDDGGLRIIDITQYDNLHLVGTCDQGGSVWGVAVEGSYAYVADYYSGLHVIDISDPHNPRKIGACSTGGSAQAVSVSGSFAYVGLGPGGLKVVDVTNPSAPVVVASRRTTNPDVGVASIGTLVFAAERYGGLHVLDSSRPPALPDLWSYSAGGYAEDVAVSGSHAFIVDSRSALLRIIDVTDPSNPQQVGACNVTYGAFAVAAQGHFAYVGSQNGFIVIDVADPTHPVEVGRLGALGWVVSVEVSGNLAYVLGTPGLIILDVSNPAQPKSIGTFDIYGGVALCLSGSFIYAINSFQGGGLHVIDVSNPAVPVQVSFVPTDDALGVAASGEFAYLSDGYILRVIYLANLANPVEIGRWDNGMSYDYDDLALRGGLGFVAGTSGGVSIFDFTNPRSPVEVGFYDTGSNADGIAISPDGLAFVADGDDGLVILSSELVATMLQNFSASIDRGAVVLEWSLGTVIPTGDISILRRTLPEGRFVREPPSITREGAKYRFRDPDCRPDATYVYRIYAREGEEENLLLETASISIPGVSLALNQNYPNPFNPATTIEYTIPRSTHVRIEIYDSMGRRVFVLSDGIQDAGRHSVRWDGTDALGNRVASGIYFYRLISGKEAVTRKMLILR